jgi:hypothetical protein
MAFSLLLVTNNCLAESQTYDCPQVFPSELIDLKKDHQNWQTYAHHPIRLHGIGFMDGPPEMRQQLTPTSSKTIGDKHVETQVFSGAYPNGKWMSCVYGDGTYTLSKELDKGIRKCSVTFTKKHRDPMVHIQNICE